MTAATETTFTLDTLDAALSRARAMFAGDVDVYVEGEHWSIAELHGQIGAPHDVDEGGETICLPIGSGALFLDRGTFESADARQVTPASRCFPATHSVRLVFADREVEIAA